MQEKFSTYFIGSKKYFNKYTFKKDLKFTWYKKMTNCYYYAIEII